jgi:replicative DNA helicase
MTRDLILPNHSEAEQVILGTVLVDAGALDTALAANLEPSDYYDERHAVIYRAYITMASKGVPIDLLSAKVTLEQSGQLEKVGAAYLASLPVGMTATAQIEYYANLIREAANRRRLIRSADTLMRAAAAPNWQWRSRYHPRTASRNPIRNRSRRAAR